MQSAERASQTIGDRVCILVEPRGDSDRDHGHDDAGNCNRPIQVDDVFHPVAADEFPERYKPGEKCHHGKKYQGERHRLRGFVRRVFVFAFLSPEDVVVQAEHVERGQGSDEAHHDTKYRTEHERGSEDFVLTEEPGERGNTRNCETGHEERDMCHGKVFAKPAHVTHFVTVNSVDDGSRAKE